MTSNVVPIRASSGAGNNKPYNIRDPLDQERMRRHLSRHWKAFLTPSEFYLLDHIIDQTVGMGRKHGPQWGFSYRTLEHGDDITTGTGLSKRQLIDLIARLVRLDFIIVERTSKGLLIMPNVQRFLEEEGQPVPTRPKKVVRKTSPLRAVKQVSRAQSGAENFTTSAQSGAENHTPGGAENFTHKSFKQGGAASRTRASGTVGNGLRPADNAIPAEEIQVEPIRASQRQRPAPAPDEETPSANPPVAPAPLSVTATDKHGAEHVVRMRQRPAPRHAAIESSPGIGRLPGETEPDTEYVPMAGPNIVLEGMKRRLAERR